MTLVAVVIGCTPRTAAKRGHRTLSRRCWRHGLVLAVLLGLGGVTLGHGAPGDLDPTFGAGGVAITFGPQDFANALALQPDGKLVVAGISAGDGRNHVLLVRYQPDGQVDTAFGPGGKVITTVDGSSGANAITPQPDGKLLVAGSASVDLSSPDTPPERDLLLVRYDPEGDLDPTFGSGGMVTTDFGGDDMASALVLQPDGHLVVAGSSPGQILLARYQPNGGLDATFGGGGKVVTTTGGIAPTNVWVVLQWDGKLVVTAGVRGISSGATILARYLPDGRLDDSFGVGGKVFVTQGILFSGLFNMPSALALQPDGKLLVMGFAIIPSSPSSQFLARFQPDGSLDPTFGQEGVALLAPPVIGQALLQQPDGKLVVAGAPSSSNSILLALLA